METSRGSGTGGSEGDEEEMKKFYCLCGFCHVRTGAIIIGLAEFLFITQTLIFVCSNMAVGNATYTASNPVIGAVIKYNYLLPILVEQMIWLLTIVVMLLGIKSMMPFLVLPHFGLQVITIFFFVAFFIQFVINYANLQDHTTINLKTKTVPTKATTKNDVNLPAAFIMAGLLFVALVEVYFANVSMMSYKFLMHEKVAVDAQKSITKSYTESTGKFKLNGSFHHKIEPLRIGSNESDGILSQRRQPVQDLSKFSVQQQRVSTISGTLTPEPLPIPKQAPYLGPFSDSESELGNTLTSIPPLVGLEATALSGRGSDRRTISEPPAHNYVNEQATSPLAAVEQPHHHRHHHHHHQQQRLPPVNNPQDGMFDPQFGGMSAAPVQSGSSRAELDNMTNERLQSVYDSLNSNGSTVTGQPQQLPNGPDGGEIANPAGSQDPMFQRRPMTALPPINLANLANQRNNQPVNNLPMNNAEQQRQLINEQRVLDTDISDILSEQHHHPSTSQAPPGITRVGQSMHHTIISTSVQIERTDSISTIHEVKQGGLSRINSVTSSFDNQQSSTEQLDNWSTQQPMINSSSATGGYYAAEETHNLEQLTSVPAIRGKVPVPQFSMDGALFNPGESGDDPEIQINVIAATPRRPSQTSSIL